LGSHEIYYWPYTNATIARYIDGFNWKGYGFIKNVVEVAKNSSNFPVSESIEGSKF